MSGLSNAQSFQVNSKVVLETEYKSDLERSLFSKINLNTYSSSTTTSATVLETSTGLRSASTVPTTIEQKVSRSTVLRNLLSKAKIGGKFARVGGGPVGFAVSTAAFYLVEQMLADEGYKYDVTLGDFVTDKEYVIIITPNDERNYGKNKFELARFGLSKDSYDYGYKSYIVN